MMAKNSISMKISTCIKRNLLLSIVSGLSWAALQTPSLALPGQTLEAVQNMVRTSETFPGMSLEYDGWAGDSYVVSIGSGDDGVVLYVFEENGISKSETLQYRHPNFSMAFERDNETGLRLIENLWGRSITEDFINSRYTDAIEDPTFRETYHFYLSDRYGYRVLALTDAYSMETIHSITLMSHDAWEGARQAARLCLNNPSHNDCQGF